MPCCSDDSDELCARQLWYLPGVIVMTQVLFVCGISALTSPR
jgi:hypothetical protein